MKNGVNLIGYTRAESGLGEACRSAAKALQAAGVPFQLINFPFHSSREGDLSWQHKEGQNPIYRTNIFFLNADQMYIQIRKKKIKTGWLSNRYNIGYWHWELPEFPDHWVKCFELVDEIWVPSSFTHHSVSSKTGKPVRIIPHAVSFDIPADRDRSIFQLPESRFLFLTMFDLFSTAARKNPYSVIKAFKQAFTKENQDAGLVIKVNNASFHPVEMEKVKQTIAGWPNIFLIEKDLCRQEVYGLMNAADCYISLHRSEGFGLPLAESMFLGKPVIATNWSGNLEFMDPGNSLLVGYTLKKVEENFGPYTTDQMWAEPDTEQAAERMRKVVENNNFAIQIGRLGKKTAESKLSPQTIGNIYKNRLKELKLY